jgi:butyryl-CoA dehydrogenase
MGALADCIIGLFALQSCILRAEKLIASKGAAGAKAAAAMTRYCAAKTAQTVEISVR